MNKLKSAQIDVKASGSGQALTSSTATPTSSSAKPTINNVTFSLTGNGDEALPNEEAMQFNVTQNITNETSKLAQVVQGDKIYIQNTKGQWYVLDKSVLKGYVDNPFSGINNSDLSLLIGLLQHTKITDNGVESLNGQNLRHITIALDQVALKQFLSNNQQLVDVLGQQNLNAIIDHTKAFNSTVDLWIDETTFYIHRTELKFNLSADTSTLPAIVGAGAQVVDAYIGPYTAIGAGARIEGGEVERSIILPGASITHLGGRLVASVVGSNARIFRDFSLPRGMRLHVGDDVEVAFS